MHGLPTAAASLYRLPIALMDAAAAPSAPTTDAVSALFESARMPDAPQGERLRGQHEFESGQLPPPRTCFWWRSAWMTRVSVRMMNLGFVKNSSCFRSCELATSNVLKL